MQKLTRNQKRWFDKLTPVNRSVTSDTYKRVMSNSSMMFAMNHACYSLAARRSQNTDGADGRFIMAGIEQMLYPWMMTPISDDEIDEAKEHCLKKSAVKAFPTEMWNLVKDNDNRLPLDVWGLPGGQTFLAKDGKYVPMMSVEGVGGIVSHLEPHLETIYAPITFATNARLMREAAGPLTAEFGLRSDISMNTHIALMLALYVGGGIVFTSDDQAEMIFPELFKAIGTVGHEFIMAYQREGISLEEAQWEAFRAFVKANDSSSLLPDVIDTIKSGLPMIMKLREEFEPQGKIVRPRFDSGNIPEQNVFWKEMCNLARSENRISKQDTFVDEDGYDPIKSRETKDAYRNAGYDPNEIIIGAGEGFRRFLSRGGASVVFKRAATFADGKLHPQIKRSNTEGKGSLPGAMRIWERGETLIVAQAEEYIKHAIMISQQLVKNGTVIYNEPFHEQYQRGNQTWDKYCNIEYSPLTQQIIAERYKEADKILKRL